MDAIKKEKNKAKELSPDKTQLLEKIKKCRKQRNLSQAQMASVIKISQAAYAKIESGDTTNITIDIGKGIAKALEISFNELFDINEIIADKLIIELENEKERLEKENERLARELDNYQTFINLLNGKNMITSPREKIQENDEFISGGDEYLKNYIETLDKENNKILEDIQRNPLIKNMLENGVITDGSYYHVWKDYLEKK